MLHLCQRITFSFTATQKYVLKNFKYLIQAPPKKPTSGFGLFLKEKTQGIAKNPTQKISELAAAWKNLTPEEKAPYQSKYKTQLEAFKKIKAQYENKYVAPFKNITSSSLFLQHLYKDKVIQLSQKTPIQDYAKEVSKHMKTKTPEQTAKYGELAKQLREQNEKKSSAFVFPQRLYNTQLAFSRNNPSLKQQQERKAGYKAYLQKWEMDVQKWLQDNKIDLSIKQFLRLYNRQLKQKSKAVQAKREKEQSQSGVQIDAKKVAKRSVRSSNAKRASKTSK